MSRKQAIARSRAIPNPAFAARRKESVFELPGDLVARSLDSARALEVGCGAGDLMTSLKQAGWLVDGIEQDPDEAEAARRTTGQSVWEGNLRRVNLPLGAYHLIVVSRVSPHFDDPLAALCRIEGLLAPGGRAVFCYPNQSSLGARIFREDWFGWEAGQQLTLSDGPALEGIAKLIGLTGRVRTEWRNAAVFFAFSRAYSTGEEPDFDRPSVTWRDRTVAWLERVLVFLGFDLGEEVIAVFHKRAAGPLI